MKASIRMEEGTNPREEEKLLTSSAFEEILKIENYDVCFCGHPRGRHEYEDFYDTDLYRKYRPIYLGCKHCVCTEFCKANNQPKR